MTQLGLTLQVSFQRFFLVIVVGFAMMIWPAFTSARLCGQETRSKNPDSTFTPINSGSQESNGKDGKLASLSTGFSYQGQLKAANGPVTGTFDFQFVLYSGQTGSEQLGVSEMKDAALTNGMFSFKLDFGGATNESKESWLEIGVRPSGGTEAYTVLFPRQKLTPTPYAIFAQHEQWSLIGVPIGFADRAVEKTPLTTDPEDVIQARANRPSPAEGKAAATETKAAAPQGTPNFLAKFDGAGNATANSIVFDNGTNVGIGTNAPDTRLDLNSSAANSQAVLAVSNGNADTRLALWSGFSAGANPPALLYTHDLRFGTVPGAAFANGSGFSEAMRITSGGRLGIGTSIPTSKVEISGAQDGLAITGFQPFLTLRDANAGGARSVVQGADGHIGLVPNSFIGTGQGAMIIRNVTGNVGIGTLNPTSKLEIAAQDGLAITGFQPFLTLRDTNTGGLRSIMAGGNGDFGFYPNSFIGGNPAVLIKNGTGNFGIGTANPQTRLDVAGTTRTGVLQITGGGDLAEPFEIARPESIQAGMVVAIDPERPGHLRIADRACDRTVAGVISGANGVNPGLTMKQEGSPVDGTHPVALAGRVYCWADASSGPIEAGDLLTTSNTPGHAMRVTDHARAQGAIIGKAMSRLEQGKGLILVLVMPQ